MTRFWRNLSLVGVALFLECSLFYAIFSVVTTLVQLPDARVPFWLGLITLAWAYVVSLYLQTIRFSLNLRGVAGLAASLGSLVVLSNIMSGSGWIPLGAIITRDLATAAAVVFGFLFLTVLWWRGAMVAQDDVTLDVIKGTFQWGMAVFFGAVLIDAVSGHDIINGFLVLGYFAVGLAGLSLARFASEAGDSQAMPRDWMIPIGVTVGGVLTLVLLLSLLGLGGLDDVTRWVFATIGKIGLWVLKPILLGLGYIAAGLAALLNWLVSVFGGGDLTALDEAQRQMEEFHESLEDTGREGPPALLVALLKWAAFLVASVVVGWVLFRLFRVRRLFRSRPVVEEIRESLFTWERANQDLASMIGGWWNNLVQSATGSSSKRPPPTNPREVYHSFLDLSGQVGLPKSGEQTPTEHQRQVTPTLPEPPVKNIVEGFQADYYGAQEAGEGGMRGLLRDWDILQQHASQMEKPEPSDDPGGPPPNSAGQGRTAGD